MSQAKCQECGAAVPENKAICSSCGTAVPAATQDGKKPKLDLTRKQKAGCCGCSVIIVVILGLAGLGALVGEGSKNETSASSPDHRKSSRQNTTGGNGGLTAPLPETQEARIAFYIQQTFGEKVKEKKDWKFAEGNQTRFIGIEEGKIATKNENGIGTGKQIIVRFWMDQAYYTNELRRTELLVHSVPVFQKIFSDPKCKDIDTVVLEPQLTLVDKYGNEERVGVAQFALYRHTAEKVKWGNIGYEMLANLLRSEGKLWFHPVLLKQEQQ